jgi:murein DD-endopeptidase MepM/ murein hydrolase activator NlpD
VGRVIAWSVAGVFAVVLLIGAAGAGAVSALLGGGGATGKVCLGTVTTPGATPAGLSAEQARNAAMILTVGQRMNVPVRGWVIAIATALQESNLINSGTSTDHDSLGLFQQRPSQGWGTPQQIMDPAYAAAKFYKALERVSGWQTTPVAEAAQAVQKSAYPDAYAKHEARATAIVKAYTGGALPDCNPVSVSADGWTRPVPGEVVSGFRTPDRPTHDGIDIAAPRGTVIRAASAGTVVTVLCNVAGKTYTPTGGSLPCDVDGNPNLGGCGWYVEIRHPGDIVSRYCHMVKQPAVQIGQTLTAGQPIGLVGTSGNSSGPHCHFEIHLGYPADRGNATDPKAFMTAHGIPM